MRALSGSIVVAVLASVVAVVAAAPPKTPAPMRKPADPETTANQLHLMAQAIVLDKEGDLRGALSKYDKALDSDETPRPAIYWNMADLERRRENYKSALKDLEKYQQLVTTDAERAEAQKFIDTITATPFRLAIPGIDGVPAAVYIDGARAGTGPMVRDLADGQHSIDLITADRYIRRDVLAKRMDAEYTGIPRPNPPASELGNVILSPSPEWGSTTSWRDENLDNAQFWLPGRFTLAPGHYETEVGGAVTRDRDRRACNKLVFDVPRDGIVYVYLQAAPRERSGGCQSFKVTTQKVVLP